MDGLKHISTLSFYIWTNTSLSKIWDQSMISLEWRFFVMRQINLFVSTSLDSLTKPSTTQDLFKGFKISQWAHHLIYLPAKTAEHKQYRALVGKLLFLERLTRPDITFTVNVLGRFLDNPTKIQFVALHNLLNYVQGTKMRSDFVNAKWIHLHGGCCKRSLLH